MDKIKERNLLILLSGLIVIFVFLFLVLSSQDVGFEYMIFVIVYSFVLSFASIPSLHFAKRQIKNRNANTSTFVLLFLSIILLVPWLNVIILGGLLRLLFPYA